MIEAIEHGPVRELRLDRPPVNALNPGLVGALTTAIEDATRTCRAIVLSGREGMFSAGLDVPVLLQLDQQGMQEFWRRFFGLLETIARCPVPVAAAVTGHAPAGGAVVSLFCDYRVMSRGGFVIGLNETRVGLLVPGVIRQALIRLAGAHRAERLIVAGALLSPDEALSAGLVDALADNPTDTVTAALGWCETHLSLPRHAMLGNRALMRGDLCELFDRLGERDIAEFVDGWFESRTQATLHALVEQLKKKG